MSAQTNSRVPGDLRCDDAHCDVSVMVFVALFTFFDWSNNICVPNRANSHSCPSHPSHQIHIDTIPNCGRNSRRQSHVSETWWHRGMDTLSVSFLLLTCWDVSTITHPHPHPAPPHPAGFEPVNLSISFVIALQALRPSATEYTWRASVNNSLTNCTATLQNGQDKTKHKNNCAWLQAGMERLSTLLTLFGGEYTGHRWIPLTKGQ